MYTPGYPQPYTQQQQQPPQRKRRKLRLLPILLLVVLLVAAVVLYVYIDNRNTKIQQEYQALVDDVNSVEGVFLPNIYVDGICVSGMQPQQAIDTVVAAVNERQNSWQVSLTYQGHTFTTFNYAALGITTDIAQVYSLLQEAYAYGHTGSLEQKKQELDQFRQLQTPYQVYTTQTSLNTDNLDLALTQLKDYFTRKPSDAYLVYFYPQSWEEPFGIQPEVYGSVLDTEAVRKQVLDMLANGISGSIELAPETMAPKVTEADVRKSVTLIAEAITPVAEDSTTARTDNIRVAFSRYHGLEVDVGETVSFNKLVGARTMENGFQLAIEYANGLNAWGWGGGVCQASTTVYLAALKANLKIVSRTSHSDKVSYTEFGQDATVYYSNGRKIDFSFKNNTTGKIYIMARVEQVKRNRYQCVVRIYGQALPDGVEYKLKTKTIETLKAPIEPEYQDDTQQQYVTYKDQAPYLLRKARDGFVCETYLQMWQHGEMVSETMISRDTCKARATLYLVGTKNR